MDALENESATVLVHHRNISETEDPFGTLEGDERWIELYGETSNESTRMARAPPSVVFDGSRMKIEGPNVKLTKQTCAPIFRLFE